MTGALDVVATAIGHCLSHLMTLQVVRQNGIGLGIVVLNHLSVDADDRDSQSLNVVREHISVKQAVVLDAIISQGLHHLVVVHLQSRM